MGKGVEKSHVFILINLYLKFNLPTSHIFETGSSYVTLAVPELEILLSQPPKCWDYRCAHHTKFIYPECRKQAAAISLMSMTLTLTTVTYKLM
jgi:hypothetical protein